MVPLLPLEKANSSVSPSINGLFDYAFAPFFLENRTDISDRGTVKVESRRAKNKIADKSIFIVTEIGEYTCKNGVNTTRSLMMHTDPMPHSSGMNNDLKRLIFGIPCEKSLIRLRVVFRISAKKTIKT